LAVASSNFSRSFSIFCITTGVSKNAVITLLTSRTKEQRQKISEAYQTAEKDVRTSFLLLLISLKRF
jgi:hypothetical protein